MKNPLVSIITPTYNSEKYLESTIQSIVNQSYKNIEYIIVDGGSTTSGTDYISNWFSEGPYASYVFIDHTMTVRHMIDNTEFSVEQANEWIEERFHLLHSQHQSNHQAHKSLPL